MVKEMPSSTVVNRDEECLRKSLMEVVKSDSSSICRLCLSKEQKLTRAFEDDSGIDDSLLKKIFDCTSVKVKLIEVFPSAICAICDLKLNEFYKFREKCIENNAILHNLLGNDDVPSGEVEGKRQPPPGEDKRESRNDSHASSIGHGRQAATSTTSISEAQQREATTVAIALNQLSELGLRPMVDLGAAAAEKSADGTEYNGTIRVAKNLLASPSAGAPTNIVSSSRIPVPEHHDPAEPPTANESGGNGAAAYNMLSAMEMSTSVSNLRAGQSREGKYECKECRRTFRNAYTLRRHHNLHTRTNLFPCEYCGKKFNDRSNWKIHQRSHTGDNLYTCLVCLKTFISPSTLKYHVRSHRRLETFKCRVCEDAFERYELLEEHARNQHQEDCMGMEDYAPDEGGEQLMDVASFVKIELEDGELPSSMDVSTTTTSGGQEEMPKSASGGGDEEEEEDLDDDDDRLPDGGGGMQQHRNDASGEGHGVVGSSSGPGCPVSHAQVAQLMEQRRQQLLEQVLQEQMNRKEETVEGSAVATTNEVTIKREPYSDGEVEVKQEPEDEACELDPSELLQQAMEEAEADDQDKELSSSSASSPSTVILFRCDYCMKIFRFLDELNEHMALHNGLQGATGNSAFLFRSFDTAATVPPPDQTTNHHPVLLVPKGPVESNDDISTLQNLKKKGSKTYSSHSNGLPPYPILPAPDRYGGKVVSEAASNGASLPAAPAEDNEEVPAPPPPEHQCSKCPKMFRTEELRRVHEATHANDELVNKVRSCRFCNKLFKCELNLLAHMRKHHKLSSFVEGIGGGGGGDSAGSGNDESCSSVSNALGRSESLPPSSSDGGVDPAEGSDGEALQGSGGGGGGQKPMSRSCEICAISFANAATLEKHVLSHFERNEAVAFVPSTDRPFKCTECHKRFKRKDYLLIHIRTHTGERRYKCDLCTSAFVHPSNLITHRKLHSNERPHKCTLCNATFKLFAGLKIHKRRCEQKLPRLPGGSDDAEADLTDLGLAKLDTGRYGTI